MTGGSISFDRIAGRYDETRGGLRRGRDVAEAIDGHLLDAGPVLEVGVGTGVVAVAMAERGRSVLGIDLAYEMLERAGGRLPGRVAQADAHGLPFGDGSVAAVYVVWVLHLVADPGGVLAECARLLRAGGRLVVVAGRPRPEPGTVPDMTPILARVEAIREARLRSDDARSVQSWAAEAGLRLVMLTERHERFEHSPAEAAHAIEQRAYSYLWDIDERTWSDIAVPVIDDLRSLPEPDRRRLVRQRQDMLVFEK